MGIELEIGDGQRRGMSSSAVRPPLRVLMLVLLGIVAVGCSTGDGDRVFGDLTIEAGEVARGDVTVIGGMLTVNGRVNGNATVAMGTLVLGPGSEVSGDVTVISGSLDRADSARIGGEFVIISIGAGTILLLGAALIVVMLVVVVVVWKLKSARSLSRVWTYRLSALLGLMLGLIAGIAARASVMTAGNVNVVVVGAIVGFLLGSGVAHLVARTRD